MKNKDLDLGKEPILPLLLKMSWPSITAMLALAVYNLIDTFWLSRISPQAIAALTICFPIQMIFGAIGVGTGVGAANRRTGHHPFSGIWNPYHPADVDFR
jgi:Na+-driven multidrug efflux pump